MALPDPGCFPGLQQSIAAVLPNRLQQAIPRLASILLIDHERLVHETSE